MVILQYSHNNPSKKSPVRVPHNINQTSLSLLKHFHFSIKWLMVILINKLYFGILLPCSGSVATSAGTRA